MTAEGKGSSSWIPTDRPVRPSLSSSSDPPYGTPFGRHLSLLHEALHCLEREGARLQRWGTHLADVLLDGARLLVVGNGGSAAHAAHLASELMVRYRCDRRPLAALALGAESSVLTAIADDWRFEDVFARQVHAFGRPGDVLLAFSTSGRSPNVLAAVEAAHEVGMVSWAATGAAPNPLVGAAHDGIAVPATSTATVQEVHQVAIHLLCESIDARVREVSR